VDVVGVDADADAQTVGELVVARVSEHLVVGDDHGQLVAVSANPAQEAARVRVGLGCRRPGPDSRCG
jgi:hypothetical protein